MFSCCMIFSNKSFVVPVSETILGDSQISNHQFQSSVVKKGGKSVLMEKDICFNAFFILTYAKTIIHKIIAKLLNLELSEQD